MSHKTPRKERLNNIASGEYLPSFHFTLYRLVISRYLLRVTYDIIIGLHVTMSKNALFVLPAGLEPATLSLWVTCSNLTELKERLPGFEPGDIYTIEHYYTPHGGFAGIQDSNLVGNAFPLQPNAFGLYPIDCLRNRTTCMQLKPPRFPFWNTSKVSSCFHRFYAASPILLSPFCQEEQVCAQEF